MKNIYIVKIANLVVKLRKIISCHIDVVVSTTVVSIVKIVISLELVVKLAVKLVKLAKLVRIVLIASIKLE